jgi:DNA polymerase-4
LDVTGSEKLFGDGETIAEDIRKKVYERLGITVSIGVSFNKVLSKLGSDMKKPDAVTVITRGNFKERVWPLPAMDLMYVGRETALKLYRNFSIRTIGDLARFNVALLHSLLGKPGIILHRYANGIDHSEVAKAGSMPHIKSIGNSTTTPRDLLSVQDVRLIVMMLAESVAARLREMGMKAKTVSISMRENTMAWCERQGKLARPSYISSEIANAAMDIFVKKYNFKTPIRSLGVRACDLLPEDATEQVSLFDDSGRRTKIEVLERAVDAIRRQHGHFKVRKASMLLDEKLTSENPKDEHLNPCINF